MKKNILAIGIATLFICMVFVPAGASLDSAKLTNVEQSEPEEGPITQFLAFGYVGGILEIEEIESCKLIGHIFGFDWYSNVKIKGYAPNTDHGANDFSVGRWIHKMYGGENITFTAKLLLRSPKLIEGETVSFGTFLPFLSMSVGIGIRVEVLETPQEK